MLKHIPRYKIATAIAIIFHAIGLLGMLFFDRDFFISTTPMHLLLMAALIFYSHKNITVGFLFFFLFCFLTGYFVELAGTSTGILFGNYAYGNALGYSFNGVPLIIGINWFVIIYCCGVGISIFMKYLVEKLGAEEIVERTHLKTLSFIVDGAILAVIFDIFLEPAAIKLGYWQWHEGEVPLYNYFCWFLVSAMMLFVFHLTRSSRPNQFAVNLIMIQLMFLLLIDTFI